jgi:hypothetical protein
MKSKEELQENMDYTIKEKRTKKKAPDLDILLQEFEEIEDNSSDTPNEGVDDYILAQMNEYDLNYNLKQLSIIYEYYELGSTNKMKKTDIIQFIIAFENDPENSEHVMKRQELWFYLEELKKDKYMKRFIWMP